MPPAARVSDLHTCPMVTGVVPHVGGPILPPGCPTILIGGLPVGADGGRGYLHRAAGRHRDRLPHRAFRRPAGRTDGRHHRARWRDLGRVPASDDRLSPTGPVRERSGLRPCADSSAAAMPVCSQLRRMTWPSIRTSPSVLTRSSRAMMPASPPLWRSRHSSAWTSNRRQWNATASGDSTSSAGAAELDHGAGLGQRDPHLQLTLRRADFQFLVALSRPHHDRPSRGQPARGCGRGRARGGFFNHGADVVDGIAC